MHIIVAMHNVSKYYSGVIHLYQADQVTKSAFSKYNTVLWFSGQFILDRLRRQVSSDAPPNSQFFLIIWAGSSGEPLPLGHVPDWSWSRASRSVLQSQWASWVCFRCGWLISEPSYYKRTRSRKISSIRMFNFPKSRSSFDLYTRRLYLQIRRASRSRANIPGEKSNADRVECKANI